MAKVNVGIDRLDSLPPVCVCCGQRATRLRQQEFEVNTATAAAVLAASVMVGALVWTKRGVTLALPVCEYHKRRGRRSNRTFFRGFALTAALGVGAYVASFADGLVASYLSVAAMFAFVVTMIAAMSEVNDGLAVKVVSAESLTLTGVHKTFAASFES